MKIKNKKIKYLFILTGIVTGVLLVVILAGPSVLQSLGLHPEYDGPTYTVEGMKALIVTTSHSVLAPEGQTEGPATGVASSELTHPYYVFLDAGMKVDIASIKGGEIPVDPLTLNYFIITDEDRRSQKDSVFQEKLRNSMRIDDVDFASYDVVFLAGGWGASYDLAQSDVLAVKISEAYYSENETILGSVCHGPLGFVNARDKEGNLLVEGRVMTGVTNRQLDALGIKFTPKHPETELKKAGAFYESDTAFNDFFATHVSIDYEQRFITGQNQNSGLEVAHLITETLSKR
jgi:putative intracellular protease/amidase